MQNRNYRPWILFGMLLIACNIFAQDTPGSAKYLAKIGSPEIVQLAQSGVPQNLIVDIEPDTIFNDFHAKKRDIDAAAKSRIASSSSSEAERVDSQSQLRSEHEANLNNFHSRLSAKKKLMSDEFAKYGVTIVKEYSDSPTLLVSVKDINGLTAVLSNKNVKSVNRADLPVTPSANWPQSYQDLTLIKSDTVNASGVKGANVAVAVFDSPVDTRALGTFDNSDASQCDGSSASPAQCRNKYAVQEILDTVCTHYGPPFPNTCKWQHGTLDSLIISKVAPAAQIDTYNLFDGNGVAASSVYFTDMLDFYLKVLNGTPIQTLFGTFLYSGKRYVAANMSIAIDQTHKYTDYCPASVGASQIAQIINAGVTVVVASGNQGWTNGLNAPACVPGVISVSAVSDSSTFGYTADGVCSQGAVSSADKVPCFANRSSQLSLYAPGVNIGDPATTGAEIGTSQAAPHVAGAVALLKSFPGGANLTPSQISALLSSTGALVADAPLGASQKHRLDVNAAVQSLGGVIQGNLMQLVPSAMTIHVGERKVFSFNTFNSNGTSVGNPTATTQIWSINDPTVASMDGAVVVGLKVGSAVANLHDSLISNPDVHAVVTVLPAQVLKGISSSPNSVSLKSPKNMTAVFSLSGVDQNGLVMSLPGPTTYSSASPAIATVSPGGGGTVTAVSVGVTQIIITSNGFTLNIPVTVSRSMSTNPPTCGRACSGLVPIPPKR